MDGSELRLLRQRLGKTQAALALALDVSTNTVARWERNELRITTPVADQINEIAIAEASGSAISPTKGLTGDPHHQAILEGLQTSLNPTLFEACAVELVRQDGWPVVPVHGGKDGGFDGAVADGDVHPFPIVTTTGEQLARNLSHSLRRVKQGKWNTRKAIFATSRRITAKVRGKLFDVANELGFNLVQTYDLHWFASRLYHDPHWCKELLNVTGRPRALSIYPKTRRPLLGDSVLGREADLQWVMGRERDCLLVGAPGSGKTFLLRSLALQGHALFLVDEDRVQLANDIRQMQPSAVIVDDAHIRPELIDDLVQIRREVNAEHIRIIATSWTGEEQELRVALQIAEKDVRQLERIDGDTMIRVIKGIGLEGPDELLSLIRQQASGWPGLGATLAHLCLIGDVRRVASGEAMLDQVLSSLDRVITNESKTLLAPFALAGDSGVDQSSVADFLRESMASVRSVLVGLAAGGIVRERPSLTSQSGPAPVSVEPPQMRWVIVRDVFFCGPGSLSYLPMLALAENQHDVLLTLIGAKSRGAEVPGLVDHLEGAQSTHIWSAYASIGPIEAQQVLERHPELILEYAQAALLYMPQEAIPRLLNYVENRFDSADFQFDKAIREILQWGIRLSPDIEIEEVSERRQSLVRATKSWWRHTLSDITAIRVMCLALSPYVDFTSPDPGSGTRLNITYGVYPLPMLEQLAKLWPDLLEVLDTATDVPWNDLFQLISNWRHGDPGIVLPAETQDFMKGLADRMLQDLTGSTREHPGVQHRLRMEMQRSGLSTPLSLDSDFELAYPERQSFSVNEHSRLAEELATAMKGRSIEAFAGSLSKMEREARYAGFRGPNSLVASACSRLAADVFDPLPIVDALMRRQISADAVEPFLERAANLNSPGWTGYLCKCLDDDLYREFAAGLVVRNPAPLDGLLDAAISKVSEMPAVVREWCARGRVAHQTLDALLCHADDMVSFSAAIGHWCADPRGTVADQHRDSWRAAVLRPVEHPDHYWDLGEILSSDGGLARDWVVSMLHQGAPSSIRLWRGETLSKAIQAMSFPQKRQVLEAIPTGKPPTFRHVAELLTEGDPDMYRELLSSEEHEAYHLSPLSGDPDQSWLVKAQIAWDAGFSVEQIAEATVAYPRTWRRSESAMWRRLRNAFEALFDNDNPVGDIARRASDLVSEHERTAKTRDDERAERGW